MTCGIYKQWLWNNDSSSYHLSFPYPPTREGTLQMVLEQRRARRQTFRRHNSCEEESIPATTSYPGIQFPAALPDHQDYNEDADSEMLEDEEDEDDDDDELLDYDEYDEVEDEDEDADIDGFEEDDGESENTMKPGATEDDAIELSDQNHVSRAKLLLYNIQRAFHKHSDGVFLFVLHHCSFVVLFAKERKEQYAWVRGKGYPVYKLWSGVVAYV